MLAFIQLGYECSVPFGNGAKYDFIADIDGKLLKFQCKSSHYTNDHGKVSTDSFTFSTSCSTTNTKVTKRYTHKKYPNKRWWQFWIKQEEYVDGYKLLIL